MEISSEELAWVAGLFEGEGCFTSAGQRQILAKIVSNDQDVVRMAYDILGVGTFKEVLHSNKCMYKWSTYTRSDFLSAFCLMRPWLGHRRVCRALELSGSQDFDFPKSTREEDVAWAAGLFEGEGCFYSIREVYPVAQLNMTDEETVNKFQSVIGLGSVNIMTPPKVTHKVQYRWTVCNRKDFRTVFELLSPWLGMRRMTRGNEVLMRS